MSKAFCLLLAFAQLPFILALPGADASLDSSRLDERAFEIATDLEPTVSYSRAITSLQSAVISVLPSITGVCTTFVDITRAGTLSSDAMNRAFIRLYPPV